METILVNKVMTGHGTVTPIDQCKEIIEKYLLQRAVWAGEEVAVWINKGDIHPHQIQPNGVDLTIEKVFKQHGNVRLCRNDGATDKGMLVEIEPLPVAGIRNKGWFLSSGYYTIQWAEEIQIPLDAIGLLSPRSTLLRTCATIYGAIWDRGYHGKGQSGLQVFDTMLIERFTRLAQIVFIEAMIDTSAYKGQYQNEGLNKDDESSK